MPDLSRAKAEIELYGMLASDLNTQSKTSLRCLSLLAKKRRRTA